MKIATWNVQGGAALPWYDNKKIKREVVDKIMEEKADIFVITEIALASGWDYFEEKMKNNGYVWFSSFVSGSNGIMILVKKNLIKNEKDLAENLWWKEETLNSYNDIGLMQVSFKMKDDKMCTVCGFRMRVGYKKGRAQYDDMRKILDREVMPIAKNCYLKNDMVVFAGDFNNARYLEDYRGKDQINYNWQILKSGFENIGYMMLDVCDIGRPIITKRKEPASPIDHIFVKGFKKEKCDVSSGDKYSVHDILWGIAKESE